MAEYIKRDAFLNDIKERYCLPCEGAGKDYNGCKCRACWVDDMCDEVIDAPAADVAPVVRCKDCKYSYEDIDGLTCIYGPCVDCTVPEDFYCKYGEREEE